MKRWMIGALLGWGLLIPLSAVEKKAAVELSVIEPDWGALEDSATADLRKAWRSALALVADDGEVLFRVGTAAPAARIRASVSGKPGAYSAVLLLEGVPSAPGAMRYLPFAQVDSGLSLEFARALESLARVLTPTPPGAPPLLVDTFSLADLESVDLPLAGSFLQPYGLTVRNGRLLVACGSAVLELDEGWQVTGLPAKALTDAGQVNFAWGLTLTPAGTLFVRSVDGSGIWSLAEGGPRPQRVRVAAPAGGSFGVLSDGSPFTVSLQPRVTQVWRSGTAVTLPMAPDSVVLAASAGPDNTLWLADTVRGNIRVVTSEGVLREIVYPDLPPGSTILKLRVLPDGSFLVATSTDLRRFDPRGRTVWVWDGKAEGLALNFTMYTDLAPGPGGVVYFNDFLGKQIYRLAESTSSLPPALARVAEADRSTRVDSRRPEPFLTLAEAYRSLGSLEAERAALDRYLELRPADVGALERRLAIHVALLKVKAGSGERDVADLVKRFGPETARDAYERAMKTLEGVRALVPQDWEIPRRMAALRKLLEEARGPSSAEPVPQVVRVELAALFPSLLQAYRTRSAGSVVLKNTLEEPISDVRVGLFLPKYMDFPSEGPVLSRLAPGEEAKLDLRALLNDRVLDVEEDVPVQILVSVKYTDAGQPRSFEFPRPITLYRRTALTWDETGKISSFVTPNEETVSKAAFQWLPSSSGKVLFSPTVQRASQLCDALGALPLHYVPDPQSNFSVVSSDPGLIDTVRFPRTTLAYQGGDCDDTTALVASMLEASGIPTAILTTPGHIFLAFDTGEKAEAAWLFAAAGYRTIPSGGTLWIPVESTNLGQGFAQSWRLASALVERYGGTPDFEFLPLAGLRTSYPALPLPPTSLPAPRPDPQTVSDLRQATADDLVKTWFQPMAADLDSHRKTLKGADWSKTSNRLAQIQARFGLASQATATLKAVLAQDKTYIPAYLNLAVLSLQAGGRDEAFAWVKAAREAVPGSTLVASFAQQAGFGLSGSTVAVAPPSAGRAGVETVPAWSDE